MAGRGAALARGSARPEWLKRARRPVRFSPGCYCVEPRERSFLWIAANELPLLDELIPFLMARSGQALDEFGRWVALRRPFEWVMTMLEYMPMSLPTREDLVRRLGEADDPEIEARRQHILRVLLETSPQTKQELIEKGRMEGEMEGRAKGEMEGRVKGEMEGRMAEARAILRRVLARRQLAPTTDDDARIEACTDLVTLERWLDRSVTAANVSDALG